MKELKDLTLQEYMEAKMSGMFWEWYPEASAKVDLDLEARRIGTFFNDEGKQSYVYDILDEQATHYIINGEEFEFLRQNT